MSDDKIVRPVFGKPVAPARAAPRDPETRKDEIELFDPPTDPAAIKRVSIDLVYIMRDMDHVQRVRDYLAKSNDFISGMADFQKSDANIKERQVAMQHMTLEEICDEAMKSTQGNWQARPSHFCAMMLEYQIRVNGAMSLLPKE